MKPPMPYFGGKQRIAARIVALFPDHDHYVEPYAGGLSVFLAKPASRIETLNDLDQAIVTFWRVLRDRPEDLERVCALTPHSRAELAAVRAGDSGDDELEAARRVWVELSQARAGKAGSGRSGWRFNIAAKQSPMSRYLSGYLARMAPAADRLKAAQLECRPALDCIRAYDTPTTLFYVDPPYLGTTRAARNRYRVEMRAEDAHRELLEVLLGIRGLVALSGYRSDLYDDALAGWHATEIPATTQQGAGSVSVARMEVVWTNYEPPQAALEGIA